MGAKNPERSRTTHYVRLLFHEPLGVGDGVMIVVANLYTRWNNYSLEDLDKSSNFLPKNQV